MHKENYVHRDIKPENILLESREDLNIKLTDFGFAQYMDNGKLSMQMGTPEYMAPEIIEGDDYDQKVDVWSAGVVAYQLFCGQTPFCDDS